MKKIFLIIIITLLFFSCSNSDKVESEYCKITSNQGKVIEESFILYDNEGREINRKIIKHDGSYYWNRSTVYSNEGKIREFIDYLDDGSVYQTIKLEYAAGNSFKDSTYDKNDNLVRYSLYKRPSADSEISLNYNPRGKLLSKEKRLFDSNGRVVKIFFYNSSGGLKGTIGYSYTKDFFKPITVIKKFKQSVQKQQYTLDASENIIREVRYTDGELQSEIVYEYDLKNNMVAIKGFKGGKPEGSKHFYYRDDNEKLVKFFLLRGTDGDIIEKGEFTYKFYKGRQGALTPQPSVVFKALFNK